jgi:Domain of unknown function (DUF4124)
MVMARARWMLGGLCTALLVGSLCFAPPSEANVYKWKDPQGRIHYTDKPPPPEGTLISIEPTWYSRRGGSAAPAATAATSPSNAPEAGTPAAEAALRNAVQNDVANVRTEQCKKAQERYQNYVVSRRLFKEGEKGERVYLSDSELTEARLNAKREMDEACAAAAEVR